MRLCLPSGYFQNTGETGQFQNSHRVNFGWYRSYSGENARSIYGGNWANFSLYIWTARIAHPEYWPEFGQYSEGKQLLKCWLYSGQLKFLRISAKPVVTFLDRSMKLTSNKFLIHAHRIISLFTIHEFNHSSSKNTKEIPELQQTISRCSTGHAARRLTFGNISMPAGPQKKEIAISTYKF